MSDKRFFAIAAAWNGIAGVAALARPALFYEIFYGYDGPLDGVWLAMHACFWFLILLFGAGYAMVGRDPVHYRGVAVLGAVGKIAFGLAWIGQVVAWRAKPALLPGAVGDLVFAALFLRWLRRTRALSRAPAQAPQREQADEK
jgi:hypothetical protein